MTPSTEPEETPTGRLRRIGVPVLGVLAAGVVLGLVAGFLVRPGAQSPSVPSVPPVAGPTGTSATSAGPDRESLAVGLVLALQRALRVGDRSALVALASPVAGARAELAVLARNVRRLRVEDLSLRYVGESALALTPAQRARWGADSWVVDADLTWRWAGADEVSSTLEVPLVLGHQGGRASLVSTRVRTDDRVPLWLISPVTVARAPRVLVVASRPARADPLLKQGRRALRTVARTLPGWSGTLVVEAPSGAARFRAVSGMSAVSARAIAAVTTTTDGSSLPTSPEHVYVNPDVYGPLEAAGQQIVLSHEATHVALGAAVSTMPLWLSEGIADYVALAGTRLPDAVLAAQVAALVRAGGVPAHLPDAADFDGANPDIGAAYEGSWLLVRMLAREHGVPALLRFYRTLDRGVDTGAALRRALGTTEDRVLRAWQRELRQVAG